MTNENDVTEADRRAMVAYEGARPIPLAPHFAEKILAGRFDAEDRVQAFARHRIQAVEAERARVVAILAEAKDIIDAVQFRSLAVRIERGDHLAGDGGDCP